MSDHLTDDQIQQLLDGSLADSNLVASHLDHCPICQNEVANYQALFVGLKEEVDFSLSVNFADTVLDKIPENSALSADPVTSASPVFSTPIIKFSDGLIGFSAIAIMVAVGLYFLDLLAIGTATRLWGLEMLASSAAALNVVKQFLSNYGINPLMVLFIVVTLSAIVVIDQIVVGMKKQRRSVTYSI